MSIIFPPGHSWLHDPGWLPDGTGMGGPGYGIKGEFLFNGLDDPLKHKRGVLSMARSQRPNSARCCRFRL